MKNPGQFYVEINTLFLWSSEIVRNPRKRREDFGRIIAKPALENESSLIIPCSLRAGKPNGTRGPRRREADLQGLQRGQSVSVGEPST